MAMPEKNIIDEYIARCEAPDVKADLEYLISYRFKNLRFLNIYTYSDRQIADAGESFEDRINALLKAVDFACIDVGDVSSDPVSRKEDIDDVVFDIRARLAYLVCIDGFADFFATSATFALANCPQREEILVSDLMTVSVPLLDFRTNEQINLDMKPECGSISWPRLSDTEIRVALTGKRGIKDIAHTTLRELKSTVRDLLD